MKRGKGILDRLTYVTELAEAPLPGQTLLELLDDRRILIEHHNGVTAYTAQKIQVKVHFGFLCISGSGLSLSKMSADQLVISGCITSITVFRGRQK